MSTIDSNQSLNAILDKLGVNKQEEATTKRRDQLGQADFLKLMTTQLQNQDPFAPMDNADFIAQMAQFSTVTGITDMGETLKGMSDQLQEFRIATASNLLGHSVLVPGNLARPDENGEIHGVVDLPSSASTSNIRFTNEQGEILHQVDMGAQPRGLVGFSWLDIPSEILESGDAIRVEAYADTGNGLEAVSPSVFADVLAATTGNGRDGVQLDVRDYGTISAAEVIKFRK
ncbi:4-hydroxy-3-methylbut-2-enyl diphosphate reductase protein [Candidatus Micropelagos thuwalensis]|uniref:Basal-body rod modification protein FlgD n=1 Tax=Candidatus Micropelagius thuwalensis TaxID=1397666 RepID=U2W9H7_9PROT|nr:flagellar hook capping FlgD N-terminal domain-containing protein [Candidatus Micropelagos thuwalensis]ERL46229.1 4-hydroxy-3-methylbut-2-enyl diphosphate reductase protein [Candidatus Micropelagos thuwalensis]